MGILDTSLAELPQVRDRLARGQQFNAYQSGDRADVWYVGIGPVTDFFLMASAHWDVANLFVDALRHAAGQAPVLSRCFDAEAQADG